MAGLDSSASLTGENFHFFPFSLIRSKTRIGSFSIKPLNLSVILRVVGIQNLSKLVKFENAVSLSMVFPLNYVAY